MTHDPTVDYNVVSYIIGEDITKMATKLSADAQKRKYSYDTKYNAEHTTRLPINLNHNTDADILAYLQTVSNKQGLIKQLIRSHMAAVGYVSPITDQDMAAVGYVPPTPNTEPLSAPDNPTAQEN